MSDFDQYLSDFEIDVDSLAAAENAALQSVDPQRHVRMQRNDTPFGQESDLLSLRGEISNLRRLHRQQNELHSTNLTAKDEQIARLESQMRRQRQDFARDLNVARSHAAFTVRFLHFALDGLSACFLPAARDESATDSSNSTPDRVFTHGRFSLANHVQCSLGVDEAGRS